MHVAGHPDRGRVVVRVHGVALGPAAGVRAAGGRRDRRPVVAQEASCWRCSPTSVPARPSRWCSSPATGGCSASVLFIVANVALGASSVVYNSFLPQIAGPDERDRVSSIGWAIGYIGGGLLLALNLVALHARRHARPVQGRRRPLVASCRPACGGPRSRRCRCCGCTTGRRSPARRTGSVLTDGFRQLGTTLRHMRAFPLTLVLPRRLPDLQRRHPDRHHAGQRLRRQGTRPDPGRCRSRRSCWCSSWRSVARCWLGRLARRYGARNTVARQPRRLDDRARARVPPAGAQAAAVHGARCC